MSDDTPDSLIPYDDIVQEALRAVVGRVLGENRNSGSELPGRTSFLHHLQDPCAGRRRSRIPARAFPGRDDDRAAEQVLGPAGRRGRFCVGLSFNQIPAELEIPFAAITAFVDPAVDFGLQFQATVADMAPTPTDDPGNDEVERDADGTVRECDDGSNVVTVDFGRKK